MEYSHFQIEMLLLLLFVCLFVLVEGTAAGSSQLPMVPQLESRFQLCSNAWVLCILYEPS